MKNLFCPISDERVNEKVTRLTALLTIVVVITAFVMGSWLLMAFLVADFFIRGFTKMKFSPMSCASYWMVKLLKLPLKQTDKAPKIFAARMGLTMTLIFSILYAMQFTAPALIVGGILIFFATLEFAFAFCAGCTIYTYLVLPFYKN